MSQLFISGTGIGGTGALVNNAGGNTSTLTSTNPITMGSATTIGGAGKYHHRQPDQCRRLPADEGGRGDVHDHGVEFERRPHDQWRPLVHEHGDVLWHGAGRRDGGQHHPRRRRHHMDRRIDDDQRQPRHLDRHEWREHQQRHDQYADSRAAHLGRAVAIRRADLWGSHCRRHRHRRAKHILRRPHTRGGDDFRAAGQLPRAGRRPDERSGWNRHADIQWRPDSCDHGVGEQSRQQCRFRREYDDPHQRSCADLFGGYDADGRNADFDRQLGQ